MFDRLRVQGLFLEIQTLLHVGQHRLIGLGFRVDRLRVAGRGGLGGRTQDKKLSKGHLPRVVYHQVYNVY